MKTVTIWGLKNKRDSFRFIHKGLYENFLKLGFDTRWVDDSAKNQYIHSDLFFVCGVASKHIKFKKHSSYILHNIDLSRDDIETIRHNNINYLNLQVFTKDANGEKLENGNIIYNQQLNTLYQPWGTPLSLNQWSDYLPKNTSKKEFWVGAIWNNQLNQGNKITMEIYKKVLKTYGVKLLQRGGSRININGVTDFKNSQLIRKSRFGSTIVGDWQRNASYIPCRLFKNISFGIAPISNMEKPIFISNNSGFIENLEELIEFAISETEGNRFKRFESAKNDMRAFTYERNILRMIKLLGSR
jgi:hypothetical protein